MTDDGVDRVVVVMYVIATVGQIKPSVVDEAADMMQTVAASSLIPMEVDKVLSRTQLSSAEGNIQE